MAILASLVTGASARASFIGLPAPLTGSSDLLETVTLTVSYEPGDVTATNLLGHELYIEFIGLTPVGGSYSLGSIYAAVDPADLFAFDGVCADALCPYPEADPISATHYFSVASLFTPVTTTGPGTLFTLDFSPVAGETTWSLNVFGESFGLGHAIYWEPPGGFFEEVPFVIRPAGAAAEPGFASVLASASITERTDPVTPMPEPTLLVLFGVGGLAAVRRFRY